MQHFLLATLHNVSGCTVTMGVAYLVASELFGGGNTTANDVIHGVSTNISPSVHQLAHRKDAPTIAP